MTKVAGVERRNGEYVVTSYTQAPPGFWTMNGRFSRVPVKTTAEELGRTVLAALDASNRIPLKGDAASSDSFAPVLSSLGLLTYAQYMKGAVSVSLEVGDDGVLRITPMRNGGVREGFVEISEQTLALTGSLPDAVGAAVVTAMAQSSA